MKLKQWVVSTLMAAGLIAFSWLVVYGMALVVG